jgi:hypothetical protein
MLNVESNDWMSSGMHVFETFVFVTGEERGSEGSGSCCSCSGCCDAGVPCDSTRDSTRGGRLCGSFGGLMAAVGDYAGKPC